MLPGSGCSTARRAGPVCSLACSARSNRDVNRVCVAQGRDGVLAHAISARLQTATGIRVMPIEAADSMKAGLSPLLLALPAHRIAGRILRLEPCLRRANLKERDENVRFKQSMTSHVSCEEQTMKLEANGNASRLDPMASFVCGFGSCGDLHIEHPQTARTGTPRGSCLPVIAGKCQPRHGRCA